MGFDREGWEKALEKVLAEPSKLRLEFTEDDARLMAGVLYDYAEAQGRTMSGEDARRVAYFMFQLERFAERAKV